MTEAHAKPAGAEGQPVEREIKLLDPRGGDAPGAFRALAALGAQVEPLGAVAQTDAYLDTARTDLARAGAALRIRREDAGEGGPVATFKGPGIVEEALHTRLELEAPWPAPTPPSLAADLPSPLRDHVEPRTWNRPLELLATIATRRERARVRWQGAVAELAVDVVDGTVRGAAAPRFAEIELELVEGPVAPLTGIAARLAGSQGLEPSSLSKLERVLDLLDRRPPEPAGERLDGAMPFRDAALVVFGRQLRRVQDEEPGTRLRTHVERLHKMRVATRRLRSAFRTFGAAFTERELAPWLRIVRRTGRALGTARDLDVLLETLAELAPALPSDVAADLEPLERLVAAMRAREQVRVLRWLTSRSRLAGFERFERFCERRGARGPVRLRLDEIAPGLILHAARRALSKGGLIGADSPPERLHRLRIELKRLRYTLEFLEDVYGRPLRQVIRRARGLQEVLGTYNDVQVQTAFLRGLIERRARRLPRRTVLAAGALLGALAVRGEDARRRFDEAWATFADARTRRTLEKALTAQI
ncbi:MAG: hypothetical protein Kow0062_27120 [Acidobacteriota bacterium]